MIYGNCFRVEMKRILWFSIGFCMPFVWLGLSYAEACITYTPNFGGEVYQYSDLTAAGDARTEWLQNNVFCCNDTYTGGSAGHQIFTSGGETFYVLYAYKQLINPSGSPRNYVQFVGTLTSICVPDSDEDGIPDGLDAYPDTNSAYQFRIMTNYFDSEGNCVAQLIVTSSGDYVLLGDLTAAEIEAGVSAGTYNSNFVNSQIWIDSSDLEEDNASDIYASGDSTTAVTTTTASGLTDSAISGTTAQTPSIQSAPTTTASDGDSDSTHYKNIVNNTNATNKNLENIAAYLGITNDYLAKLNDKTGSISSGASTTDSDTGTTPTADEIGQAVKDNLIDSGQTIDTTITDNISALDETDTLAATKTKYSDRYDLFITTLKESDLFSLPFGIFTGPSGSGSSIQTVNIGKWGSSNEQTATIDYSDYDNIWDILRSVLLLLTSFSCFKILVLKKA